MPAGATLLPLIASRPATRNNLGFDGALAGRSLWCRRERLHVQPRRPHHNRPARLPQAAWQFITANS